MKSGLRPPRPFRVADAFVESPRLPVFGGDDDRHTPRSGYLRKPFGVREQSLAEPVPSILRVGRENVDVPMTRDHGLQLYQ